MVNSLREDVLRSDVVLDLTSKAFITAVVGLWGSSENDDFLVWASKIIFLQDLAA